MEPYTFTDEYGNRQTVHPAHLDLHGYSARVARELLRVVEENARERDLIAQGLAREARLEARIAALESDLATARTALDPRSPHEEDGRSVAERVEAAEEERLYDTATIIGLENRVHALEAERDYWRKAAEEEEVNLRRSWDRQARSDGLIEEQEAALAALEEERTVLRKLVQDLERSEGRLIDERDAMTASVDAIADELGVEAEWTNQTDRGEEAVEAAARLTAHAAALEAENERLRRALVLIRDQGTGRYEHGHRRMVGATGEPWLHWASIAEQALAPATSEDPVASAEFIQDAGKGDRK